MTAVQIHSDLPTPAPVTPGGWRRTGPLSGWRDDDPDALPRCSVNRAHVIRNGDDYAIAGTWLACLPCARLAPPAPVEPRQPKPAPVQVRGTAAGGPRCQLCGAGFAPTRRLPRHCSWTCEMKQAAMPAEHGPICPCLRCATERAQAIEVRR